MLVRRTVRFFDERLGVAPVLRSAMRYVFPDHWSFMLGEIALYAFMVLVGTGIFLTFFYVPSDAETVYRGAYEPLQGTVAGENYLSTVRLSFDVPAGLLMRQTHHWAANVFIGAIALHMLRILLTGAFRKPREINYVIGLTMLTLAILNGYAGYSLLDDMLSGMGLAIGYSTALSIPLIGEDVAFLIWGSEFPGSTDFWPRLEIVHVLIVPVIIAGLITVHLAMIMRQHHTQFPGRWRTERNTVGTPMWPGYALRSTGLLFLVVGVLFLLGGLVQINPIWLWGPYEPHLSTNAAQPDYYVGWLIGALRIMPPLELQVRDVTVVPNAFWGGLAFPAVVFGVLYLFPLIDRRFFGDGRKHELVERPRDNPRRSAFVIALLAWVFIVFLAGTSDRIFYRLDISYEAQIWFFRIASVVGPFVVYAVVRRVLSELKERESRPLRGFTGSVVRRGPHGGFETLAVEDGRLAPVDGRDGGDGAVAQVNEGLGAEQAPRSGPAEPAPPGQGVREAGAPHGEGH